MSTCSSCGSQNRAGARYCWSCAAPLDASVAAIARPTQDDTRWLAATLSSQESSSSAPLSVATGQTTPLSPSANVQEEPMDQSQPPVPTLFGGRYELLSTGDQGQVEVLDHEPWRRCWACGSTANEAGEAFCSDCGAALEQRRYSGVLLPAATPSGPALVSLVQDGAARAVLPAIWDQVEADGRILVLLQDSGRGPVALPLDETAALRVGLDLARLLVALHSQGLVLGAVQPTNLEVTAAGEPRLRQVPGMRQLTDEERGAAISADLRDLAALIEALTDTPRTTQRLEEDAALAAANEPNLTTILRQVRTETIEKADDLAERLEALLLERTRPLALRQRVGALSDTGIVRDHNEDSLFTLNLSMDNTSIVRSWGLYIVADGMGGHAAGEVASGLALRGAAELILSEYLPPNLNIEANYDEQQVRELVRRAALQANEYVIREAHARGNDMGSTLTMALVIGDRAIVANVGDSRTYLYREGKLRRISRDHSLVMRLVELGQIDDEDIYSHPQRNAVLRSLGDKSDVEVDLFSERLHPGDALLLCSDGQWEMTRDPEMERLISKYDDPQQVCQELIKAANQAGGEDNITAVLVRFG